MVADELQRRLAQDGFCIVPDMLTRDELGRARSALDRGIELIRGSGMATHDPRLDPNASNIRVYNLPALDPIFIDLLGRPSARGLVEAALGPDYIASNFTANVALPGSGSMRLHADQALVIPPPWDQPWAVNVIWCLDDVHADNGATRYVPGSHRYRTFEDVPPDAGARTLPFEATAGSVIAMEGRVWHTSGANVTADQQRRLIFAYYTMDFIRPQVNWEAVLPEETKVTLDPETRRLFGLGPVANTRMGARLATLLANGT